MVCEAQLANQCVCVCVSVSFGAFTVLFSRRDAFLCSLFGNAPVSVYECARVYSAVFVVLSLLFFVLFYLFFSPRECLALSSCCEEFDSLFCCMSHSYFLVVYLFRWWCALLIFGVGHCSTGRKHGNQAQPAEAIFHGLIVVGIGGAESVVRKWGHLEPPIE